MEIRCEWIQRRHVQIGKMPVCAAHELYSAGTIRLTCCWSQARSHTSITLLHRENSVITVPELAADALGTFLASNMQRRFGASSARLVDTVPSIARIALECIGNSD